MSKNSQLTKDDLLETLTGFYTEQIKPDLMSLEDRLGGRIDKVDNRLDSVEIELRGVKDEVKGLKAEFSTSVSKKDFNKLKSRVDKHHPVN